MRVDTLAKTIAADILAERRTVTFPGCFMCGRTYSRGVMAGRRKPRDAFLLDTVPETVSIPDCRRAASARRPAVCPTTATAFASNAKAASSAKEALREVTG